MNEHDFSYLARLAGIDVNRVRTVHELFESELPFRLLRDTARKPPADWTKSS